jgi:hypothetical protein
VSTVGSRKNPPSFRREPGRRPPPVATWRLRHPASRYDVTVAELARRDQRPISVAGSCPGRPRCRGALDQRGHHVVEQVVVHVQARPAVHACPWLKKIAVRGRRRDLRRVGVREDDVRGLAAQLQRDLLQVAVAASATPARPRSSR